MDLKRNYEVSIWTLQDEFITVLKPCNVENLGRLENKELELNADDGINKYSFSIPMYIYKGVERIENPIWYNTLNGNIIANMRKIKVIINKKTDVEAVYEFMIIKVEERHEKDQLYCDVTCEDLAYNELGKIGYKLELSQEVYENEYNEWRDSDMTSEEPINNLQYWNTHQLHLYSINKDKIINDKGEVIAGQPLSNKWYYMVEMDWTAYADSANRETEKVYEEEYTASWKELNNKLVAAKVENYKEKARSIDAKESNLFNLTQTIAEKFEIFVRYEYLYDSNYHITGRRIIYYNNFMREKEGYLDITYPYDTNTIKREIDGADITTKMYVRPIDADVGDSGVFSITEVGANKSKEDYLLNFEYMYQIGAINAEQYLEIPKYEQVMRRLNIQHQNISTTIEGLTTEINELKSSIASLTVQKQKDEEAINDAEEKLKAILMKYGNGNLVPIGNNRPETAILKPQSDGKYYIDISQEGIARETLHLYQNYKSTEESKLSNELHGVFVDNDNGDLIRVKDISVTEIEINNVIYITYSYSPTLKTERVKEAYTAKLRSDTDKLNKAQEELDSKQEIFNTLSNQKEEIEESQNLERKKFEEMMGPALRESYWQPDDYKDSGDKYIDEINNQKLNGESGYTNFVWDSKLFEGEQDTKYASGINAIDIYYPCITLTSDALRLIQEAKDAEHEKTVSFVFYDNLVEDDSNLYTVKNLRIFPLGDEVTQSRARYGFGKLLNGQGEETGSVTPILILTGAEAASDSTMKNLITRRIVNGVVKSPLLAIVEPKTNYNPKTDDDPLIISDYCSVTWFNLNKETQNNEIINYEWKPVKAYYPRIQVDSMLLNENAVALHCGNENNLLKQYEDYYIFFRTENLARESNNLDYKTYKYITIKPKSYILNGNDINFKLNFSLHNASTSIYLDALQVMKENSMPKVSYTVEPNFVNDTLYYNLYQHLNRIVNINDRDLKLVNVQGYISKITLDLDNPFNDKIDIKNYKSKFEDLFTSIVAQTEAMKKNGFVMGLASAAFTPTGALAPATIQQSINRADLQYAFNQGNLTIDEENGIWATSDEGVVAMRGGGIFTATQKDDEDNWIWNTGILPSGINASLITTGQLDTNLIRIYAGDKLRLQMNGDGYFAYKSLFDDPEILNLIEDEAGDQSIIEDIQDNLKENGQLDLKQYVVHNENGLFLRAENGAIIKDQDSNTNEKQIKLLNQDIDRVEVSWNGLKLRDWNNNLTLDTNPDTGDLTITGTLNATGLHIGREEDENPEDVVVSGAKLQFTGQSGISINTPGALNIDTPNFKVNENGEVTIKGNLVATSLEIGEGAIEGLNDGITQTDSYQDTQVILEPVTQKLQELQTLTFKPDEGLIIRAEDTSSYYTVTTNDGYKIKYNNIDVASFTGNVATMNNLQIGSIIATKTVTNGWAWIDA